MRFICTEVRFGFFNGLEFYTVEFSYQLRKWFVFEQIDNKSCDAVFIKVPKYQREKTANRVSAKDILNQYLESIKQ